MTKYTQEQIDAYRQVWLAQLRNPEAKKETTRLECAYDRKSRCCLGHACHALGIDSKLIDIPSCRVEYQGVYYGGNSKHLPIEAQQKLNIDSSGSFKEEIKVEGQDEYSKLISLVNVNDETNLSPREIADVIEDQFKNDNFVTFYASL